MVLQYLGLRLFYLFPVKMAALCVRYIEYCLDYRSSLLCVCFLFPGEAGVFSKWKEGGG